MKILEIKNQEGKIIAYEWEGLYYSPEERKDLEKLENITLNSDLPSADNRFMTMGTQEYLDYLMHRDRPKKEEED